VQGRTAFSLIMHNQTAASRSKGARIGLEDGGWNSNERESSVIRESIQGNKWRDMDDTIEEVGDWATKALPALLEITKRGGRFELRELERVRTSFAVAVQEAQRQWENKAQPAEFAEFVRLRELAGEDLKLTKGGWTKDKESPTCQLCTGK
jgi:hypothetical protein